MNFQFSVDDFLVSNQKKNLTQEDHQLLDGSESNIDGLEQLVEKTIENMHDTSVNLQYLKRLTNELNQVAEKQSSLISQLQQLNPSSNN